MVAGLSNRVGPRFPVLPSPVPVFAMGSPSPYYENGGYWGTPDRGNNYISGVWQGTPFPGHLGGYGGYIGGGNAWSPPPGPSYTLYGQADPPPIYGAPHTLYHSVAAMNPPGEDEKKSEEKPPEMKKPEEPGKVGTGANLKFTVPAATKLYVDGRLTTSGGTERVFTTPPLAAGQKFYYDVKAELTVNGKPVVEEKRVVVEAGSKITESFDRLIAAANATGVVVAGK
jgi:uncharacterized protein (TIGR03000 family)